MFKQLLTLSIILVGGFFHNALAQSCSGSLGDPIVNINFGTSSPISIAGLTNYTGPTSGCPNDGYYTITSSLNGCFSNSWHNITDHTGGGQAFVVNAAYTAGLFYNETVSGLCGGSTYEFSTWITNVLRPTACTSNPNRNPNITLRIETTTGTLLKTIDTGTIPTTSSLTWNRYATFFTTPSGVSTVVLKLINNAPGGCGNDLAIDDIQFRPCGPTLSATAAPSATICAGSSINLSSNITSGYNTPVYQWQESTDNVNFTNITGATNTSYALTTPPSGVKYYRILASESGNINNTKCRIASNVITVTVNAIPAAPTASTTVERCQNGSSAALTATGSNLQWYTSATGGSPIATPTPSTTTVGTTTYYVSQTVSGCESARTRIDVHVNPAVSLSLTSTTATVACAAGTLLANTTGGTPGYSYSLNGGASQTSNAFSGLAAGTYNVVVTDSKGCTANSSFTIAAANPLALSVVPSNDCSLTLPNGVVSVEGSGGIAPLSYKIDNVAQSGTGPFSGISAGAHTVTLTDNNGCIINASVTIPSVNPIGISLTSSTTCTPDGQGSIAVSGANGTAPYRYQIGSGSFQSSNTFTGLSAGTYTLTVRDSKNCTAALPVTIKRKPNAPTIATLVEYCVGASPSALSPTLESSATANWYTVASGGTASGTAPTISTASAGTTTYYVSQTLNGCEGDRSPVIVTIYPTPSVTATTTNTCAGSNNGTLTMVVSSGTSPFSYALNGGAAQSSAVFNSLGTGTYNLSISDAKGCTATGSATVSQSPAFTVNATTGPATCIGLAGGTITVSTSIGGTFSYKLNSGDFQTSNTFSSLNPGDYQITVKDAAGCTNTGTASFNDIPLSVASSNSPSCLVAGANTIELSAADAGTGVTFAWTGPNSFTSTTQNPQIPYTSTAQNGIYTLTATKNGCTATATINVACTNPLPITLMSFDGVQQGDSVILAWRTLKEINAAYFQILRANDARSFEDIGHILAAGESNQVKYYSFVDKNPIQDIGYYRLKMIDKDGSFEVSKIISIRYSSENHTVLVVNPAENEITLKTDLDSPTFEIFDALGRKIGVESINKQGNTYQIRVALSNNNQTLVIRTMGNDKVYINKIILR